MTDQLDRSIARAEVQRQIQEWTARATAGQRRVEGELAEGAERAGVTLTAYLDALLALYRSTQRWDEELTAMALEGTRLVARANTLGVPMPPLPAGPKLDVDAAIRQAMAPSEERAAEAQAELARLKATRTVSPVASIGREAVPDASGY